MSLKLLTSFVFALTVSVQISGCALFIKSTENTKKELSKEERSQLYFDMASASFQDGDMPGCLQYATEADKLKPNWSELYHLKALALYERKRIPEATEAAKKSVELNPKYMDATNTLGKMLLDNGRPEEGEKYLKIAADDLLYRDAYRPATSLGLYYFRQNKLAIARDYFSKAIDSAPAQSCVAQFYLGKISATEHKNPESIHYFKQASASRFCTNIKEAHLELGMAFERDKQFDAARKKYLDVAKLFPNTDLSKQAIDRLRYLP